MTDQPGFVAPAGWYVDPTTSLFLRWWSGLAWTEHVATIPEVETAPDAYPEAAPTLPHGSESSVEAANTQAASVEAANVETADVQPADVQPADIQIGDRPAADVQAADSSTADVDLALPPPPVPRFAPVSSYGWEREALKSESAPLRTLPVGFGPEYTAVPSRWSSFSVWVIAFTPWITLMAFAAVLLLMNGQIWLQWGAVALPWLITLAAAQRDVKRLRRWGHQKLASWTWALLGAPAYLIARTVVLRRNTGIGSAPLWVWIANFLLVGGLIAFAIVVFAALFAQFNGGFRAI